MSKCAEAASRIGLRITLLAGLLLPLLLMGCVQVQEISPSPTPSPSGAGNSLSLGQEHDVAILGVDFNPSSDSLRDVNQKTTITLSVAVENRGYQRESEISVMARLLGDKGADLLKQTSIIKSLAPGGIEIVDFSSVVAALQGSEFRLEISVNPVPNEAQIANNYKSYEVSISSSQ
jgi:hypothetical protein